MTHEEKTDNWVSVGKMAEEYQRQSKASNAIMYVQDASGNITINKNNWEDIHEEIESLKILLDAERKYNRNAVTPENRTRCLQIASTLPHGSLDELIATAGKIEMYLRERR